MLATQNAQRSGRLSELRQRWRRFISGAGFEVGPQHPPDNPAERLVLLGPISTKDDVPAIARIPWSVFVSRHLGVGALTTETLASAEPHLGAMTPGQCANREPLSQDIVERVDEAGIHFAAIGGRSYG
jgi:hypothetical protein